MLKDTGLSLLQAGSSYSCSQVAFSQILQKLELRKGKASPKVMELVGGGLDSHPGHLPPGHSRGRSQAKGLAGAGMEKEKSPGSLGFF